MKDLDTMRKELDTIDEKLSALFLERLEISRRIGLFKKENSMGVNDPGREKDILARITRDAGGDAQFLEELYGKIFEISKKVQK